MQIKLKHRDALFAFHPEKQAFLGIKSIFLQKMKTPSVLLPISNF